MARIVILGLGGHARTLSKCLAGREFTFADWDLAEHIRTGATDRDAMVLIGTDQPERKERIASAVGSGPWATACHITACAAYLDHVGSHFLAHSFVDNSARLGDFVTVNTGAQIDHDCVIGDFCTIAPGAILCGGVRLGKSCYIGAGAIVLENVEFAAETFVPAGTLVVGQNDMRRPVPMVRSRAIPPDLVEEDVGLSEAPIG